jgi:hypothetical protein
MSNNQVSTNFKATIKDFIALDDEIRILQQEIRDRQKIKKQLSSNIVDFMVSNQLDNKQISVSDSNLKVKTSIRTESLNKSYLENKLTQFFSGDINKAKQCAEYLYNNRSKNEVKVLSRTKNKN